MDRCVHRRVLYFSVVSAPPFEPVLHDGIEKTDCLMWCRECGAACLIHNRGIERPEPSSWAQPEFLGKLEETIDDLKLALEERGGRL